MSVTTELLLVRHGEAHCNVSGRVGGEGTCTGLTEHGRGQVSRLAHRLRREHATTPINALYTSPRRRTLETASLLSEELGLEPHVMPALRGLDHGEADGRPWSTIKTRFGGRPQRYPNKAIAPGAESWNTYLDRCRATLQRILEAHIGERVLIAAHGETIEASFTLFYRLALDGQEHPGQVTSHACLTRWQYHRNRFDHGVWMLAGHNDTRHLEPQGEEGR
ncbi:histidine phosphatase family protein [Sciscionella sediminilitoris]|uniref:histidine phosphatase family protein n=1 Tax=Sciscionella sediminilitoris TaxID=1445613 RepID=UPI0004DEEC4A|nr:histidine phosphatase family protein [Sciscionella sp. SE31]